MSIDTFHFKGFSIVLADMRCEVRLDRFASQFARAQYWLDNQMLTDMIPHMPFLTGTFISRTRAESAALAGSGLVVAGVGPMGQYLHEGKVMVNAATGKGPANIPGVGPRFRKGAKLMPTSRNLKYSNGRGPQWVPVTVNAHKKEWVKEVKHIAGGG